MHTVATLQEIFGFALLDVRVVRRTETFMKKFNA